MAEDRRKSHAFRRDFLRMSQLASTIQSVYQLDAVLSKVADPVQRAEMRKLMLPLIPEESKIRV